MTEKDGILTFESDKDKNGNEILNSSQRNNELIWPTEKEYPKAQYRTSWKNMCNVTSYVMALEYSGWKFPKGKFKQPEDNLGYFILTDKSVREKMKKNAPVMYDLWMKSLEGKCTEKELKYDMYFPTELHDYLSFGANQWLGKEASQFETNRPFRLALYQSMVQNNLPIVVSTTFGGFGHIVCVTGVQYTKKDFDTLNVPIPSAIIVDDPWGKYNPKTNKYDAPNGGNDIVIPWDVVVQRVKPAGSDDVKWMHTFKHGIATV